MATSIVIEEEFLAGEADADLAVWHVATGDQVTDGQPIAEIETAKVQLTVNASASGQITILVEEGALINPGDTIATIEES